MTRKALHTRIPPFPYACSLQGAQLECVYTEARISRRDLIMEYQEYSPERQELFQRDGRIFVHLQGLRISRGLRFKGVDGLEMTGAFADLDGTPSDHPARQVRDMLRWIIPGQTRAFHVLFTCSRVERDGLEFLAGDVIAEPRPALAVPFDLVRDWQSPPPFRPGLVPSPKSIYNRFGGDPVTIHIDSLPYHRRLFIGSMDTQFDGRPDVASVLNLGEQPNRWAVDGPIPAGDRWENKGEGAQGMGLEEIRREAEWVIERLRKGGRVLVHCVGGMNRSSTLCCAVLILLEGLSAEMALARVREHHPWARPDSNHWLKLLWLANSNQNIGN